jgi:hypothetical protein
MRKSSSALSFFLAINWTSQTFALSGRSVACSSGPLCIINPDVETEKFILLEMTTGLPILQSGREATIATEIFNISKNTFHFQKASGAPIGLYDLVYSQENQTSFLGISDSGRVVFETARFVIPLPGQISYRRRFSFT